MTTNGATVEDVATDEPGLAEPGAPSIVEALCAVMVDVGAVRKEGRNTSQNFNFRGIDQVMNAVGPALRAHKVIIVPTVEKANYREVEVGQKRTLQRECTVKITYTAYGPAGDSISGTVYGEALDSGDKATAKAHSVAYRTFLLQALTIPTDEPDPDEHSVERAPAREQQPTGPQFISAANLERFLERCTDKHLDDDDVAEIVGRATGDRTKDPAFVLVSEVVDLRAAMEQVLTDKATPADVQPGEVVPEADA